MRALEDLHKALINGYNGLAGVDLNTTEQSIDAAVAAKHPLIERISHTMSDVNLYEQQIIALSPDHDLEITKIDAGVYDATVVCSNPDLGTYGDKLLVLNKITVEALVQGLKAKELIPDTTSFGLSTIQPESLVSPLVMPKSAATPEVEPANNPLLDLHGALKGFKGQLHIHLQKSPINRSTGSLNLQHAIIKSKG